MGSFNGFLLPKTSGGAGGGIKSIQTGIFEYGAVTYPYTFSIAEVNPDNCVVLLEGGAYNTRTQCFPYFSDLTKNSLTVGLNKSQQSKDTIKWTVIEFKGVKSIQRGISSGYYQTQTISAVNIEKTLVIASGGADYGSDYSLFGIGVLLSSTQLYLRLNGSTAASPSQYVGNIKLNWQAIEFE